MTLYTRDFETVKRSIHMGGVKSLDWVFVCKLYKEYNEFYYSTKFLFGFYYKMVI